MHNREFQGQRKAFSVYGVHRKFNMKIFCHLPGQVQAHPRGFPFPFVSVAGESPVKQERKVSPFYADPIVMNGQADGVFLRQQTAGQAENFFLFAVVFVFAGVADGLGQYEQQALSVGEDRDVFDIQREPYLL